MKKHIYFFLILLFLVAECTSVPEKRVLLSPNPTSFVFDVSIDHLREAIFLNFNHLEYRDMMLCFNGSSYKPLDTLEILDQPGNEGDFYLESTKLSIGKSYIYPKNDYVVSFHLHTRPIDSAHAELMVISIRPRIVTGQELWPQPPHFVRPVKYKIVDPSTIEEYEILERIGKFIGQSMPTTKYP